jgi:hypothetical protein
MKETENQIVVFGQSNYRFDIPKSHIIAAGRNVILNMDFLRYSNIRLIRMRLCLQGNLWIK